jgi:hypothetical protein
VYTDTLSKCLVESTTTKDRNNLVRWVFAAASQHPAVKDMSAVTDEQLDQANKQLAELFIKLLTESCVEETKKAIAYEGTGTLPASFETLGRVAGVELFSSPEVNACMAGMQKHLDKEKLNTVLKDN